MWGILLGILLAVLSILAWLTNAIGLPGNWFVLGLAALHAYLAPSDWRVDLTWPLLIVLLLLAVAGEGVEFLAGAMGASSVGASRRGVVLAVLGSIVGGLVGIFITLPVPLAPLVGALVFGGVGAFVGAVLGEQWKGRDLEASMQVGWAAFWGRLLGTFGKLTLGAMMVALVLGGLLVRWA